MSLRNFQNSPLNYGSIIGGLIIGFSLWLGRALVFSNEGAGLGWLLVIILFIYGAYIIFAMWRQTVTMDRSHIQIATLFKTDKIPFKEITGLYRGGFYLGSQSFQINTKKRLKPFNINSPPLRTDQLDDIMNHVEKRTGLTTFSIRNPEKEW